MSGTARRSARLQAPGIALTLLALNGLVSAPARADDDFIVYSPYVVKDQSEVELRGIQFRDSDPTFNTTLDYELSVSHAFNDWWRPEVYLGAFERTPADGNHLLGYEFENTFQLTDPGEYWLDAGFLASYEHRGRPGDVSRLEFGPLLEKRSDRFDQRLNLIWEKQLGSGADGKYEFRSSYALSYKIESAFAPGFEVYLRPADNSYSIGPVINGEIASAQGNEFEYRFGVVFGVNPGAPNQVFMAQLEYEFF
jgi:hypothetical protein